MKKLTITLLLFAITLMFFYCSNEDKNKEEKENLDIIAGEFDSTDLNTSNVDEVVADSSFNIVYKFNAGDSFNYRFTTLSHSERNLKADTVIKNILDQKVIRLINFFTVAVERDSVAELICTIESIRFEAISLNDTVTYRSGDIFDSIEAKKFIEYEGLVNNPFHIRITKYGELLDIYKVDKITERYLELSGLKDSIRIEEKATFQNEILNSLLIPLIKQVFRELPSEEISIGYSWTRMMNPATLMVFRMQNTNHFKISDLEMLNDKKIAVITGTASTSVEGKTKHSNNGIDYEFNQPVSEAGGKLFFNLDEGLIQRSKTKTKLVISYYMQMMTPQGQKKGFTSESILNDNILELL